MNKTNYTTQLQAGLGMIEETLHILDYYTPGINAAALGKTVLVNGGFQNITARRLRNIVSECFAPRFLVDNGRPAIVAVTLRDVLDSTSLNQLFMIYACRANLILYDFIVGVYWNAYCAGRLEILNDDAKNFVIQANQNGFTQKSWSESTIKRVSAYLVGACADFGLLEKGRKSNRRIKPFRISSKMSLLLAYELHFSGLSDSAIVNHTDWQLFGLNQSDVIAVFKQLSNEGHFLMQYAGDIIRICWQYKDLVELKDVIAKE